MAHYRLKQLSKGSAYYELHVYANSEPQREAFKEAIQQIIDAWPDDSHNIDSGQVTHNYPTYSAGVTVHLNFGPAHMNYEKR